MVDNGLVVEVVRVEDMESVKQELGISDEMESCHTAYVRGYFVEGHMPVEAIRKLLRQIPRIDGIALPGMPSGSPGMGGSQEDPFTHYALKDGRKSIFMVVPPG